MVDTCNLFHMTCSHPIGFVVNLLINNHQTKAACSC